MYEASVIFLYYSTLAVIVSANVSSLLQTSHKGGTFCRLENIIGVLYEDIVTLSNSIYLIKLYLIVISQIMIMIQKFSIV